MAKPLKPETVLKKLKSVSNTQDSIPMLSLWIIHHKAHHKLIVDHWLKVLKNSKASHRLTLLYLCNDVIQNCRRKNAAIYKETFTDTLPEAVAHLRDQSIRSNVQRVMKIWSKRGVFDSEYTDQLLAALLANRAPEKLRNKLLVEYKTSDLISEITQFKELEDKIGVDEKRLRAIRVDVSSTEAIKKLKDKVGGEKFSREFEESAAQLEEFLGQFEKYVEQRKQLLEVLEKGTVYYHAQYHEAKIVVNAYKNFEGRVNKMKRGLDKLKSKFPSPVHSPSVDAPSPVNTPLDVDDNQEDMEMSDEDKELGNKPSKIVASGKSFRSKTVAEKKPDEENVLKLITSNINVLKNQNESAAESLKRVVSGLVNRPGMRGLANSTGEKDTSRSLTITRSNDLQSGSLDDSMKISTPGSASPPSPTGSPDLNISSPPRHQSLDSRLADLFSSGAAGAVMKDSAESDTESDVVGPPESLETKLKSLAAGLPGLGGLNEIKVTNSDDLPAPPMNFYSSNQVSSADTITTSVKSTENSVKPTSSVSINQSIPVIRSSSRIDTEGGSSTPTMDENPPFIHSSSIDNKLKNSQSFLSPPGFLSAPNNPFNFLSNVLGSSTKQEATPEAPPADQKDPNDRNLDKQPYEHTSTSNIPSFTTEWDKRQAARGSSSQGSSSTSKWENFTVSVSTSSSTSPIPPPPAPWDFPLLSSVMRNEEPQMKKTKWDDAGGYRDDPSESANMEAAFTATASATSNRRNSNLITLSTQDSEPIPTPASAPSATETPSKNRFNPISHKDSDDKNSWHSETLQRKPQSSYDEYSDSNPTHQFQNFALTPELPKHQSQNGSQYKHQQESYHEHHKPAEEYRPSSSSHHYGKEQERSFSHSHDRIHREKDRPTSGPRFLSRGHGTSQIQRGPRPSFQSARPRAPVPLYDDHYEEQLLQLELEMLEEDQRIDAAVQRELSMRGPSYGSRQPRPWQRAPVPQREHQQRPRIIRGGMPPRPLRGMARPRMWY